MSDARPAHPSRRRRLLVIALSILGALIITAVVVLWLLPSSTAGPTPPEAAAPANDEGEAIDGFGAVIHKSSRHLTLYRPGREPKTFSIALGSVPEGDKGRINDGRTPEGTFYVCEKNSKSKYYLFIGLSYPNREAADRGLADDLITDAEHDAIVAALNAHRTPPWYTRLGGEIGIHGGGASWDWTSGCVAMENADMREVFAALPLGATVRIEP